MGLLVVAGASGCKRETVTSYQAPKDQEAAAPPAAMMNPGPASGAGGGGVQWKLPAGWQELPPGDMRVGNFAVSGAGGQKAQVTIIPLPGMAGGELPNVNRWRGQVGLEAVDEAAMAKDRQAVQIGGQAGELFDLAGTPPGQTSKTRMLAAIQHRDGTAWFFKMTGDDALVAQQKATFVEFLKGLNFSASGAAAPSAAAPALPPMGGTDLSGGMPAMGKPSWTVPHGWGETPPGPMQSARFTAGDPAGGAAEITVVALPGDAGGLLANINRWRRQIGLPPVEEAGLAGLTRDLTTPGGKVVLVDLSGEKTPKTLVAAVVSRGGNTWFYKLMGDAAAVSREKAAFVPFVESARYAP